MEWIIYWIGVLDSLNAFWVWFVVVSTIAAIILGITAAVMIAEEYGEIVTDPSERLKMGRSCLKWAKISIMIAVLGGFLKIFTPEKETLIAMYIIPKIAVNEQIQELPDNILEFINTWVKEQTEDLKK